MLSPSPIIRLATDYWQSRAFLAAVHLRIFEHLGSDGRSLADLSAATGVAQDKLNILVGALRELKLVEDCAHTGDIRPTEISQIYLNPDSPACLSPSLQYSREMFKMWDYLEQRLTTSQPAVPTPTKKDTPSFLAGMHARAMMLSHAVMPLLAIKKEDSVLDVAAGAGTWSWLVQKSFGTTDMTLLEQEELHDPMKTFISGKGMQGAKTIAADYHQWQAGRTWSCVLYFGALHQEKPGMIDPVLSKLWQAVQPGGRLLILDIFYAREEAQSLFAYLFGLNMMLTTDGSVHGLEEVQRVIQGFPAVSTTKVHRLRGDMPYYLLEIVK